MTLQGARDTLDKTPVHYNVGFIVLSYIISLIGCVTTLELLHRRTSRRGAYNWYLLISSCITMGAVGIWCMHFVGNRAIVMQPSQSAQQIVYSPGFTAVSFFLPIVVLFVAFYILGITDRVNRYYVTISGILAGTAICGMHYVGQLGIANYYCSYRVQNVIGAAVIAVAASLIALGVFFRLRESWTDSWGKRSLCGAMLAGAVSGMHWTAAVGTNYQPRGGDMRNSSHTQISTIIVATVLSVVTCVILLCFALVTTRKKHIYKTRSQQLVLACGYFSQDGRVMVTAEGGLPCAKITNHYVERTFGEDELSRSHPTFVWVFKASRNWLAIKTLIPGMKAGLESDPVARKYRPGETTPTDDGSEASLDFSTVFKQLFCVAAQNLANTIHEPLEKLGVLFEEPLETGTTNRRAKGGGKLDLRRLSCSSSAKAEDAPVVPAAFGRGQYLSVTRQLTAAEVNKFAALGYRFAACPSIAETMAKTMQVPQSWMLARLDRMRKSATSENLLAPGVHLACFMVRPSVHKSFDVLVPTNLQNQLPATSLPLETLSPWQTKMLQKFENMSIASILKILIHASGSFELEQDFRWQLYRALSQLVELINDPSFMMQAKFSAKVVRAPCRPPPGTTGPATCMLLSVRGMQNIHAQAPRSGLTYVPLSFFSAQQQMDSGPASHERFARQAQAEFAYCQGGGGQAGSRDQLAKRRKSWGEIRGGGGGLSVPASPMTPSSFFRPSFSQRPGSRGRASEGSGEAIVGLGEGEREWVEMMEKRRRGGEGEVEEGKSKEVVVGVSTLNLTDSSESESVDEEDQGRPEEQQKQTMDVDKNVEAAVAEVPGSPTTARERLQRSPSAVEINGERSLAEKEPGTGTFVNELFALFKL